MTSQEEMKFPGHPLLDPRTIVTIAQPGEGVMEHYNANLRLPKRGVLGKIVKLRFAQSQAPKVVDLAVDDPLAGHPGGIQAGHGDGDAAYFERRKKPIGRLCDCSRKEGTDELGIALHRLE